MGRIGSLSIAVALVFAAMTATAWAHQEANLYAQFGGKGTMTGQFSDDTQFFADGIGNLYVSDATYKRIQKFDADGNVALEIDNTTQSGATLRSPKALAVDASGTIYVVDLEFVAVENAVGIGAHYYGHAIHRFYRDGSYRDTLQYLPLNQKQPYPETADLAINPKGELTAMVRFGELDRSVLLAVSPAGETYVYDQDYIYKLDADGALLGSFAGYGSRPGETDTATSLSVSANGNLYVTDSVNHRVVVFDSEGEFVRDFGVAGTKNGQLKEPTVAAAQTSGSVYVGDSAQYTRVHASDIPIRKEDPSPQLPTKMTPWQYRLTSTRLFTTFITRVQEFSADGSFVNKTLVRFPTDSYDSWHYELRAIGADGRLYYQHKNTLVVRVYAPTEGVSWRSVHKTLHLDFDLDTLDQQIDNPDIDDVLGTGADYRARGWLFQDKELDFLIPRGAVGGSAFGSLRFEYDYSERERLGLSGGFYALRSRSEQLFTSEAGLDPERSFPQDDRDELRFDSAELQFSWERTLNDDPYRYRRMTTFFNMSVGSVTNDNYAVAASNLRRMRTYQEFLDWETGVEYDFAPRMFATLSVLRGPANGGFNGWWTFVDETGALFARGFNDGRETRVQWQLEGYL